MPLQITGHHMSVSDELKGYIDKKVNRLRRMCPKIDEMHIILRKEKLAFEAEASFRAGKVTAQANTEGTKPHEAVDILVDKIEAQVTKQKDKQADRSPMARQKAQAHEAELESVELRAEVEDEEVQSEMESA